MKRNVIEESDAARSMMQALGLVGAFDVRADGSRSTGFVGKPGDGDDVRVTITIEPFDAEPST